MYVRRNYSESYIRAKPPKRRPLWPLVVVIVALLGGAAWFVQQRPADIEQVALRFLGVPPTPLPNPAALLQQAESAYENGQLTQAVTLLEQVTQQRPEALDAWYLMGQLLIDLDRPAEALPIAERLSQANSNDVRAYALRARAQVWLGDSSAGLATALAGLEVNREFADLYEAYSRALVGEQRWRESQEAGLEAMRLAPDDVRAYWAYANALMAVGAATDAIPILEQAIERQPFFTPPYFELAFLYLAANRDRDAIDLYDRILGIDPRNARALLRQCEAYRKVGEFQRAVGVCQDAVDSDPSYTPAQYRLGMIRYSRREFDAAQAAFSTCMQYDPGNLDCQVMQGLSSYYQQDCSLARTRLEEAARAASARNDASAQQALIAEGLAAIDSDPTCTGLPSAGVPATPSPAPAEATPEVS